MSQTFQRLLLNDWRQFATVEVPLGRQVTVLTGPNGCGKTTILNTLSRHFGWNINLVSTPFLSERQRERIWSEFGKSWVEGDEASYRSMRQVGSIQYSSGGTCSLHVPAEASANPQYSLQYDGQQPVHGLNIPSHQPALGYRRVNEIPTDPKAAQRHYQEFQQLLLQSYVSDKSQNPGLALKKSLIALAVFGPGSESVAPNREYAEIFESFQEVLRRVLPRDLGFRRLEIRMPEIVLVTATGDFSLDAMSGGIGAVFMVAWQVHIFGRRSDAPCTVVLDEPENHLHPSMQRTLLPSLADSFPQHRFIVSTHSPFVVSSDPRAAVVALTFNDERKIVSQVLEEADLAGSPTRILREILDVPTTVPVWVEEKVREVLERHSFEADPEIRASRIFSELQNLGLTQPLTEVRLDSKR